MDSGVLPVEHTGTEVRLPSTGHVARRAARRPAGAALVTEYARPEPPAVVVAGSPAAAKGAVLGELLRGGNPVLDLPDESYLVLRHGARRTARAFLPGSGQPYPFAASTPGLNQPEGRPPRPPRRVELTLPASPLTSFVLVAAPAGGAFGPAYNRIVLDTAELGGAVLFTLDAQVLPGQAELDFLVEAGLRAATFFFAWWVGDAPHIDDLTARMAAFRDVVASRVPSFAEAPWFPVVPGSGAVDLRQALADWSGGAAPADPAGGAAPADPLAGPRGGARRRVPTAVDGRESGWEDVLDRAAKAAQHSVRQALTIELANIHLRCVQDVVFAGGCAGMPAALDREMHALSLLGADEVEAAITEITRQVLAHVLAEPPHQDVLCRVADALRQRIEEDGPDLSRVLLVTSTSGAIAAVSGTPAATALAAYRTQTSPGVLPPLGIGLAASCYKKWRGEGGGGRESTGTSTADADAARGWLQDAVRGTELELQRVLTERFEVVHQVLSGLVADAVDHGLLLV